MSTIGIRDYRPSLHFTPLKGWTNDPNGLVFDGQKYHLFAQHYPHDGVWGPMHWLHAVSEDLVSWEHLGIALEPDELGTIFSGCAIVDENNVAGFGEGAIIAMFTHHGDTEQQSIAYSTDGIHFAKYANNPVIANPGLRDFRDPNLFWNEKYGCYSVAIAASDRVAFYRSEDLLRWTRTGDFGSVENQLGGVFECPAIFPLTAPNGEEVWVLVNSMGLPDELGGPRTQYFLGTFDGDAFRQTIACGETLYLDAGYDNYAAIAYNGTKERLLVGWAACPSYAAEVPTGEYCGIMTLARRAKLVDTDAGIRLAVEPVLPKASEPVKFDGTLPGEVFAMTVKANGAFEVRFENDEGECLIISLSENGEYVVDRSQSTKAIFGNRYNAPRHQIIRAKRNVRGPVEMTIVFDRSIAEIYSDDGAFVCTSLVFPEKPYVRAALSGATGEIVAL